MASNYDKHIFRQLEEVLKKCDSCRLAFYYILKLLFFCKFKNQFYVIL